MLWYVLYTRATSHTLCISYIVDIHCYVRCTFLKYVVRTRTYTNFSKHNLTVYFNHLYGKYYFFVDVRYLHCGIELPCMERCMYVTFTRSTVTYGLSCITTSIIVPFLECPCNNMQTQSQTK